MIQRAKTSKKKKKDDQPSKFRSNDDQFINIIQQSDMKQKSSAIQKKKTIAARFLTVSWMTSKKLYVISSLFCRATHTRSASIRKKKHKKQSAEKTKKNDH